MLEIKFQKILKELMQSAGISQKQLALSTGIPVSSIASWYGKQSSLPNIEYVAKLAQFFNCSIDYLAGVELEDGRKIFDETVVKSSKSEIQTIYDDLDEVKQRMALNYIKRLRDIELDDRQITSGSHRTKRA